MDWSTYYPAFIAPQDQSQVDSTVSPPEDAEKRAKKLLKDVEVADIGCGFGGLLVALAPKLPDKLLLGKLIKGASQNLDHTDTGQVWKSGRKSQNMSKNELKPYEPRTWKVASTRTRRV